MPFDYVNLDAPTRAFMVEEIDLDISSGKMNPSSWLSSSGLLEWPSLLLDAARMATTAGLPNNSDPNGD